MAHYGRFDDGSPTFPQEPSRSALPGKAALRLDPGMPGNPQCMSRPESGVRPVAKTVATIPGLPKHG